MDSAFVAVTAGDWLSTTRAVKFDVPATGDVPLIVPLDEHESPVGSDPPEIDHVKGATPPVEARVCA